LLEIKVAYFVEQFKSHMVTPWSISFVPKDLVFLVFLFISQDQT
jgi:hypothetical protein